MRDHYEIDMRRSGMRKRRKHKSSLKLWILLIVIAALAIFGAVELVEYVMDNFRPVETVPAQATPPAVTEQQAQAPKPAEPVLNGYQQKEENSINKSIFHLIKKIKAEPFDAYLESGYRQATYPITSTNSPRLSSVNFYTACSHWMNIGGIRMQRTRAKAQNLIQ